MKNVKIQISTGFFRYGLTAVNALFVKTAVFLIYCYKASISRYLGGQCRFVPSCSDYAVQALRKFGFLKGGLKAVWRILRCNPFGGRGFDPVDEL